VCGICVISSFEICFLCQQHFHSLNTGQGSEDEGEKENTKKNTKVEKEDVEGRMKAKVEKKKE
jgi:hypothetical protein